MPTLKLKIAPLQNPERYAQLARALTAITAELLGKRAGVTAVGEEASYVIVRQLPADNWGYGGRTQSERKQAATAA